MMLVSNWMVSFGNFFIAKKGSFGWNIRMKIITKTTRMLEYLHDKANPMQAKPASDILRIQALIHVYKWRFIFQVLILVLSILGQLGLLYLNWSFYQEFFDNTKVVVYFIIKVGMVASIRSFMQTLSLELYLAHKHYSYELMHVHVLECIKIVYFKPYISGFFIKRKWIIPQVLIKEKIMILQIVICFWSMPKQKTLKCPNSTKKTHQQKPIYTSCNKLVTLCTLIAHILSILIPITCGMKTQRRTLTWDV